jgi:hypothetical protein
MPIIGDFDRRPDAKADFFTVGSAFDVLCWKFRFCGEAGRLNQQVAATVTHAVFVAAGLPLTLRLADKEKAARSAGGFSVWP